MGAGRADFVTDLRPQGSEGSYVLAIPRRYEGMPGQPFGGVTAAVALRAAGLEADHHHPVSLSLHFLRQVMLEAETELRVEPLRRGRRSEVLRVAMRQAGEPVVHAVVTSSVSPPPAAGIEPRFYPPDGVPPIGDPPNLPRMADVMRAGSYPLPEEHNIETLDCRVLTDPAVRSRAGPDHQHRYLFWGSYGSASEDPWIETARQTVLTDGHGPAAALRAGIAADPNTLVPRPDVQATVGVNLDLTVHYHHPEPSTDWLWSEAYAPFAADGLASGTCRVWSADGRLLASSVAQVVFVPAG